MSTRSERNVKQLVPAIEATFFPDDPYRFDVDQNGFPVFSDKNIAFVNGLVNNDSNYTWIDPGTISSLFERASDGDRNAIRDVVYFTNKMNSTHLAAVTAKDKQQGLMNSLKWDRLNGLETFLEEEFELPGGKDKVGLTGGTKLTAAFLVEKYSGNDGFRRDLQAGNLDVRANLVANIARATTNMASKLLPEQLRGDAKYNRSNFSFATKLCHHGCRNVSDFCKDNFCIYDTVVGTMLPYYADAYIKDVEWLNNEWSNKYNKTKSGRSNSGSYDNRYAWLRGTIANKLVATPEGIGEEFDAQVARGYRGYYELYSRIVDGINEWRRQNDKTCGAQGSSASDIGFHEVDLLIWYYFKGRRLDDAKNRMEDLVK